MCITLVGFGKLNNLAHRQAEILSPASTLLITGDQISYDVPEFLVPRYRICFPQMHRPVVVKHDTARAVAVRRITFIKGCNLGFILCKDISELLHPDAFQHNSFCSSASISSLASLG